MNDQWGVFGTNTRRKTMIDAHNENLSDVYAASPSRYDTMIYRRCGRNGINTARTDTRVMANFDGYKKF
jgi:hypothetical protein